jgi:hypothetical protein
MRVWDLEPRDGLKLAAILMATALINLPEHPRRLDVRLQAQIVNPCTAQLDGFRKILHLRQLVVSQSGDASAKFLLSSAPGRVVRAELQMPGDHPIAWHLEKNRARTGRRHAFLPARATAQW